VENNKTKAFDSSYASYNIFPNTGQDNNKIYFDINHHHTS